VNSGILFFAESNKRTVLEHYGRPKEKTIEKPPAHASGLQQQDDIAAAEHLSPMRGPLRAAPGLPGLWLL
jgi:hypothetical protein